MSVYSKCVMLKRLCEEYKLHFVDCTVWCGYEWIYIASYQHQESYIKKLSPDQIREMTTRQIKELVVQCALTDIGSEANGQD